MLNVESNNLDEASSALQDGSSTKNDKPTLSISINSLVCYTHSERSKKATNIYCKQIFSKIGLQLLSVMSRLYAQEVDQILQIELVLSRSGI